MRISNISKFSNKQQLEDNFFEVFEGFLVKVLFCDI
jgi:hypothetical protein